MHLKIFISILLYLLFNLLNKIIIKKDIKVALCSIVKNENLYIREFIEHYKKIGYNKIFIYDNNEKNGENLGDVINDYINSGFVNLIDFKEITPNKRPQIEAYIDCYSRNNKSFNWISFFDIDELLEINKKYRTIQDFLKDNIFEFCKNIKINWLEFSDDNKLYYENKPLQERFKIFNYEHISNKHIKSTVRGNLSVNYWKSAPTPHTSNLNIISCSSSGKKISSNSPFNYPPDYTNAKLKHYSYKSFEEICWKLKKGKADSTKIQNDIIIKNDFKRLYIENKHNIEKLKILYKVFNVSSVQNNETFF